MISIPSHLARLKAAIFSTFGLADAPTWIEKHTYLKGNRFSFEGHEFQQRILSDLSVEVNTQKCSQIGLSEAQARWTLAVSRILPAFSTIYTMPFAKDAGMFCRTRFDPIINNSPDLSEAVNPALNNSEIKQFGDSFIYFRGTNGETQAISIPADAIVSDEIDRSDPAILTQYASRVTHSPWKLRRNFSTPTVDGFGIALKMKTSRRFQNLCKCDKCSEWFLPDYFSQVKIPGFDNDLRNIDKNALHVINWKQARLRCPKCGKQPDLSPARREWVQENQLDQHDAAGYYVSPFDAPKLITAAYLVKSSTEYANYSEFINQNLGLTALDSEESLVLDDLVKATVPNDLKDNGIYAMGVDLGLTCHIVIGRLDNSLLIVVHRERVPLGRLEERTQQLSAEFRVVMKVFDAQPFTDLIMRMQARDHNLFAALFVTSKNMESFVTKQQDDNPESGKLQVRQVQINRNKAFDELVGQIKGPKPSSKLEPRLPGLVVVGSAENEIFNAECLDMKRVKKWDANTELTFTWVKSEEQMDHYFHALLYMFVAARLRGMATGVGDWPSIVSKFRVKQKEADPRERFKV